ncbi:hypothetical protein GCM10010347_51820 [Streptomyces cirratus]|uniref:Uncharacterized protein n=1 Tax=Streptomyces cirratus TaxID=68187 RepID=A0ABQ3F2U1_9ACTN|nr:hypothetical protein GCM10010347_51820 [Streptomyces cirratus]
MSRRDLVDGLQKGVVQIITVDYGAYIHLGGAVVTHTAPIRQHHDRDGFTYLAQAVAIDDQHIGWREDAPVFHIEGVPPPLADESPDPPPQ